MKFYSSKTIRQKIQSLSLFLVLTTAVLGMTTTLAFSLRMEYDNLDRNLMNSALVLAQSPDVADVLAGRSDGEVLTDYLNGTISRVQDIDAIVVADTSGTIVYSPDPSYVGTTYPDLDNLTVLHGQDSEVDTGAGISGVEHRAQAAVHDTDGTLLGFVSVGIGVRSVNRTVIDTRLSPPAWVWSSPATSPTPLRSRSWAMNRIPSCGCSTSARAFWTPWKKAFWPLIPTPGSSI